MSNLDNIKLEVDNDKKMKDFISAQEMLKKMSERLNFSDEEKEIATNFLRCNNYYSFMIYIKQLPDSAGKTYSFSESQQ